MKKGKLKPISTLQSIVILKYCKEKQKAVATTIELKYPTQAEIDAVVSQALSDPYVISITYNLPDGTETVKEGMFTFNM